MLNSKSSSSKVLTYEVRLSTSILQHSLITATNYETNKCSYQLTLTLSNRVNSPEGVGLELQFELVREIRLITV